jgi:hypothetical protein
MVAAMAARAASHWAAGVILAVNACLAAPVAWVGSGARHRQQYPMASIMVVALQLVQWRVMAFSLCGGLFDEGDWVAFDVGGPGG